MVTDHTRDDVSAPKALVTETGRDSQFKGKTEMPLCAEHHSSGGTGVSKREALALCLLNPCAAGHLTTPSRNGFVPRRGEVCQARGLVMGDTEGAVMLLQPGAF